MQINKIRVGILFGGKSAEHEVSLQSAKNVIDAMDKDRYEVVLMGIDKQGRWLLNEHSEFLLNANDPKLIKLNNASDVVALIPESKGTVSNFTQQNNDTKIDVVFPILHGPFGEDGTIQGLLKLVNIPFVGSGVLASAVGMDKDIMKRLFRDAGLPIARFKTFTRHIDMNFDQLQKEFGLPLFVKPANMGSSVGVSKVRTLGDFNFAVSEAFNFDHKVIVEENIAGREIECSVLGNEQPIASVPGEVIPTHDYYSYDAKYIDEHGAKLEIPAKLSSDITARIQEMAIAAFKTLSCEGLARADFFVTPDDQIILNEVNTMPGFTSISMYPMLWKESGISYSELIDRLISLAIDRFNREQLLQTSYI